MDRSSHVSGISTFDRVAWDVPPAVAGAYATREGSGVVLQARSAQSRTAHGPESEALVILVMRDARHRYDEASIGGLAVDRGLARGRFALIPPGRDSRWVSEGHPALVHINFAPERLAQLDALAAGPFNYSLRANAHDPVIDRVAGQLASEIAAPGPLTELAIDTLLLGLALHVARHYSSRTGARHAPAGRLASWRLGRVLDFIESHLGDAVSLERLAREAGLSIAHFSRCFKATLGVSVHRYVLERRVERAKQLLVDTDLPIAEVALACGFASQSHLTDCFRSLTRSTPGAWRRSAARGDVARALEPAGHALAIHFPQFDSQRSYQ